LRSGALLVSWLINIGGTLVILFAMQGTASRIRTCR
jgi:hypothetical protein